MAIDRTSVTIGVDAETGLTKKRLFIRMEASAELQYIRTYYQEWLETETGAKVNLQDSYYDTIDVPAVYQVAGGIKTPAILNEDGSVKTPAVLYDGTEVITSENLRFTKWVNAIGNNIIIPAINQTLLTLP